MAKKSQAVEVVREQAITVYNYGDDEQGAGYEHQTKADTKVPLLVLLQGLSPMVVEGTNDAKAGQWLHTVTEQLYDRDEGFLFVPATTRHFFAEWTPRDEGGGFHGHHEIDSNEVKEALRSATKFGKNKLPNGNDLVETFYVYGVVCSEEGHGESMGVISFTSTKIKSYKTWMTRLRQFVIRTPNGPKRPPLYAHLTRISSESQKNSQGQFYVPRISSPFGGGIGQSLLDPTDERFVLAKACRDLVDSGDAQVDPNQGANQDTGQENVPF